MNTDNTSLTAEESMQIITQSLSVFRKNYKIKSSYLLLWGWIVALASLTHFGLIRYLLYQENYTKIGLYSSLLWGVFVLTGFVIQLAFFRRTNKLSEVKTHVDRFYTILWIVAGVTFVVVSLLCVKFKIYPTPFVLAIAGMATLISGLAIRFTPLIIGGIIFFIFTGITAYTLNEYQLLYYTFAITCGYIIPGYMLRNAKE